MFRISLAFVFMLASSALSGASPDLARDAMQKTADRWFHWLLISSAVVFLGVAFETWEATITLKRWWGLRRDKEVNAPNEKSWAIPASYLGLLLVIVGVFGEGAFEALVSNADTALRAHDSQVLAQALMDAGSAKNSAETASSAASLANDESDKANSVANGAIKKAAGVARQTIALEAREDALGEKILQAKAFADMAIARTRPRAYRMDDKKFLEKLRGVTPGNVEVWYKTEDSEAYELASKIVQLLGNGADGTGKDGLSWKNVIGPLPLKDKPRLWAKDATDIPPSAFLAAGFAFGGGFAVADAAAVREPNGGATVWKLSGALDASGIHFMWITQDASVPANTVRVIILSQFD